MKRFILVLFLILNFTRFIYSQTLPGPQLLSPPDQSSHSTAPTLQWSQVSGNAGYYVQVNNAAGNEVCGSMVGANTTSWVVSGFGSLTLNINYYWRVRTRSATGELGPWSNQYWAFKKIVPFQVTNVSVTANPSSVQQNGTVTATANISATGNGAVTYYWENINGGNYHKSANQSITVNNGTVTVTNGAFSLWTDQTGQWTIRLVVISPNSKVAETYYTVTPPFQVTNVSLTVNPSSVQQNKTVTATATISATGSGTVTYYWKNTNGADYYKSTNYSVTVNNGTVTVTYSSLWTDKIGQWTVRLTVISPNSKVAEAYYTVFAFQVTNVTLTVNPSSVIQNGTVTATATITATGSGDVIYYWENTNGADYKKSTNFSTTVNSGNATITNGTFSLWTDKSGQWTVRLTITSPNSKVAETYYTVTPFQVTNVSITVNPSSVQLNGTATATAIISATGSGTITYYWENSKSDGTNYKKSTNQSVMVNNGTATITNGTFLLWTDSYGEWNIWLVIMIPNSITGKAIYQVSKPSLTVSANKNILHFYEELKFTITVQDQNNIPIQNKTVMIYDPNLNYCPLVFTGTDGKAIYTSNVDTLEGWKLYGFYVDEVTLEYSVVVYNQNFSDPDVIIINEQNPLGFVPPLGQTQKQITNDDVMDVFLTSSVNTITNPVIIGGSLLCAGGIVGSFFTAGATSPVAAVVCAATIEAAYGSFVMEAGKEAAKKLIDHSDLDYSTKDKYKRSIDVVSWGVDMISFGNGIIDAPKGGKSVLSYKISNNQGNFANKYAKDFLGQMYSFSDAVSSTADFDKILIKKESVNDSIETINLICTIKDPNNSLSTRSALGKTMMFDRYQIANIGFSFNKNKIVPVELSSFTGTFETQSMGVLLTWQTTTETNNYGFEIQREILGEWKKVGFVNGNGTTTVQHTYTFFDDLKNFKFQSDNIPEAIRYRLKQIDFNGTFENSNVIEVSINQQLLTFKLGQNYPNPFNSTTTINFSLPQSNFVTLKIFDVSGREVMTILNEKKQAGIYSLTFDASNLSSGLYFYKFQAGSFVEIKKMVVMK